jgi:hypothetical protein
MPLPKGAKRVAREFARAIVRRKWDDIPPLLTAGLQARLSPASLAGEFGWDALEPRLRQMHADLTGEEPDPDDPLDPPRRFEVFEVEDEVGGEPVRQPPAGHDSAVPVGWVEVDFLPDEDSAFDQCYNCLLAFVDEDGPRVTAYVIESATD